MFGGGSGSEGGGPTALDGGFPGKLEPTTKEVLNGLNPLQHVPVVGMVYRAATGETIPTPMRVLGAGILGGGLGMIGAAFMSLFEELVRMGPDTSRPSTPAGMSQTGSEAGVEPVTPGTLTGNAYTTLATTTPEFLQGSGPNTAFVQNGTAAYQQASMEWQRSQWAEKGIA
jgi:hypothetical protein